MNELPPEARQALSLLRDTQDPTEADRARVRALLAKRLQVEAARPWRWRLPLTVLGVLGALAAAGGWYGTVRPPEAVVVPAPRNIVATDISERQDAIVRAPTIPAPEAPAPTVAPAEPPTPPAAVPAPSPAPARPEARDPEAELRLLTEANGRLRRGDPGGALTALGTHRQRFPRGALREEREALRVLALCALHRDAEARAVAARFLATWPRSPQASRVRSSCGAP
ncbi:MAG: hypothetical protein HY909_04710 [Deltaproteobacteria bacterium]|nr:hypothetical protein [Deltaproteobacteria bacterium]